MKKRAKQFFDIRFALSSGFVLGLVMIGLIWAGLSFHLSEARDHALKGAEQNLSNLARTFEEHTVRSIQEVDKTLLLLRTAYELDPDGFDLGSFTSNPYFLDNLTLQVAMIGPDGMMLATNLGKTATPVDLRDREHFRVHQQRIEDELFISKPVLGRASGKWSVQLTRRLSGPGGEFAGVLVASLDPRHFSRFYEAIDLGPGGGITLVGTDGVVRALGGDIGEPVGRSVLAGPLFAALAKAGNGGYQAEGPADGAARLTAYRTVRGYPLAVAVSMAARRVFAQPDHDRARYTAIAALMTMFVLAGMLLGVRHHRRLAGSQAARQESEALAIRKSRELEATLEHMSQGIMMIDAGREVAVLNRKAVDLLGLPEDLALGRPRFDDILRWQEAAGEFNSDPEVRDFVANGGIGEVGRFYQRTRPNGTVLEVRSVALADGGVVRTYTDVSARARAEAELAAALDRAEAASRARGMFLAMMSHEMRTPLNGVIGMASLLGGTRLDAEQRRYAATLRESAEHLLQIINDVLDLSKLEADRLELRNERFDLRKLADGVLEILAPAANEKGLRLETDLDAAAPRWVEGDPSVLRQILLNLAGNAVKFTDKGSVTIRIAPDSAMDDDAPVEGDAERPVRLSFAVEDTGIGIAEENLPLLFREFSQVDEGTSRRFGGTGLGLAICRKLVARMGGWIDVQSRPGAGSRFHFTARFGAAEQNMGAPDAPEDDGRFGELEAEPAGPPLRILLAEDNRTNRLVIGTLLEKLGHHVHAVEDGALAVEAVQTAPYDLVLMDVMMPEMDGLEATRAIRALSSPCATVPIVGLTANALPENAAAGRAAGMNAFATKPITGRRLGELIREVGGAHGKPAVSAAPAVHKGAILDRGTLDRFIADIGAATADDIVRVFLRDTQERIAAMPAQVADRGPLVRDAHSIKSAAATLGLTAMCDVAARLEAQASSMSPDALACSIDDLGRAFVDARRALPETLKAD
ncbi:hypothetical protein GCM10007036_15260 [Alsobacter metallidurans]|uniref:histidine kinase n=1 Tax=Alsobacter metallidurans TaxID=340221 RepID=A0A917I6L7_9HYPH|nr:ATP-binding protein [Alsobacter metallidurans]GGH15323.1 hypothetical protein GCM10007036_15260 [Alsobacter metallidurans]